MKGLFVDAGGRRITPVNYTYATMWEWLPGGITIAKIFPNGDVLYVDDEALLHPVKVAFRLRDSTDEMQPFVSNGLLTGRDHGKKTLPPAMSADELAQHIVWLTVEEAMNWFRSRANQPSAALTFDTGEVHVLSCWGDYLRGMEGKE
jgi:hypothetical protein